MKRKKPVKKRNPRRRRISNSYRNYIYRRYNGFGINDSSDWEIYDSSRIKMLCINCYGQFYIWSDDKFQAKNWFCDDCRLKISKRKWQLIAKFHKHMEAARFRRKNPVSLDHGDVLGFTNSMFRCIRGKASREHVIKTIKLAIDLASYVDPITLGRLLDLYDRIVGIHAKRRY
jgi:hypothetical protein